LRHSEVATADTFGRDLGQFIANSTPVLETQGIGTEPRSADPGY
jgi:hypothetical protein